MIPTACCACAGWRWYIDGGERGDFQLRVCAHFVNSSIVFILISCRVMGFINISGGPGKMLGAQYMHAVNVCIYSHSAHVDRNLDLAKLKVCIGM